MVDTWATIQEVADITGAVVTNEQLFPAQEVIDLYSNRTMAAASGLRARDIVWLRKAVAWQAVWQAQQFGFSGRNQMVELAQDGLKVKFPNPSGATLSPLAARALRNLSWKGSKTLRVASVEVRTGVGNLIDYSLEATDELHDWKPL